MRDLTVVGLVLLLDAPQSKTLKLMTLLLAAAVLVVLTQTTLSAARQMAGAPPTLLRYHIAEPMNT